VGEASEGGTVLAVTSPGGVVLDTRAVVEALGGAHWVAVDAVDTRRVLADQVVVWVPEVGARPGPWLANLRLAWRTLRDERPSRIVSAGTGVAVPWFLVARLRSVPTVWIETWNLVGTEQGHAAALCSRLARSVAVQRPERLHVHRRAVLVGELY
jgi:hypothetical protein